MGNKLILKIMMAIMIVGIIVINPIVVNAASIEDCNVIYDSLELEYKQKVTLTGNTLDIDGKAIKVIDKNDTANTTASSMTLGSYTFKVTSKNVNDIESALKSLKTRQDKQENKTSTSDTQQEIRDMIGKTNIKADIEQATNSLSGLEGFVSTAMGIMLYITMLGMSLFTATDMLYITQPVFRGWADTQGQSGGAVSSTSQTKTGDSKFRFVTDEAIFAVRTCSVESGKSAVSKYLWSRMGAFILTGIAVYILVSGNIGLITGIVLKFLSGFIEALENLSV